VAKQKLNKLDKEIESEVVIEEEPKSVTLGDEGFGASYNKTTKKWQLVHLSFELVTGTAKVSKVGLTHENKMLIQQEINRLMVNKLMGVKS
jgi:hypothetical protein